MKITKNKMVLTCVLVIILISLVCVGGIIWYEHQSTLKLSVQATLYVSSSDDDSSKGNSDAYRPYRIFPNQTVDVEDIQYHEAELKQGILNTDFYYGSLSISGSFPLSDLKVHWESIPFEEDWPFRIYLFNTNDNRAFQACLELEIYTDQFQAQAALQIYYKNKAYCETLYWTGSIGAEIVFNCEV